VVSPKTQNQKERAMRTKEKGQDGREFRSQGGNVTVCVWECGHSEAMAASIRQMADIAIDVRTIADPAVRDDIRAADIVCGVDTATGRVVPIWGRSVYEAFVKGGVAQKISMLAFSMDFASSDVEYLIAACSVIKDVPNYEDELLAFRSVEA
jgi:hypothetical protein